MYNKNPLVFMTSRDFLLRKMISIRNQGKCERMQMA